MNDLEKSDMYREIADILDNVEEVFDNYCIEPESDEEFAEIADKIEQIRSIITE